MRLTLASRTRPRALALAAAALAGLSAGSASAYDTLGTPCPGEPFTCQRAPIAFEKKSGPPIEWSFDTGWVPSGSNLQVHLFAGVYAHTYVSLTGALDTSWPDALTLRAPGDEDGGTFRMHYGLEVGAKGKVSISVLGKTYTWVGDLPYVPQVDFQVKAQGKFDAWAYAPGVVLDGTTEPVTLASIGVGDIIGGSIPGIDGGFDLDVAVELEATYTTDRIVVESIEGEPVEGGPLLAQDDQTITSFAGGPRVELDVHPEGTVRYDGVLHLVPSFYVTLLGKKWTMPVADIPMPFPLTTVPWVFDPMRVRVPLPELVLFDEELDLGQVKVGEEAIRSFELFNAGDASVMATVVSSLPDVFPVWDPTAELDPATSFDTAVRFVPKKSGPIEATILVGSNDPLHPVKSITVRGFGVGGLPGDGNGDGDFLKSSGDDGGCACRAAGEPQESPSRTVSATLAAAALGLVLARRRRRRA